MVLTVVGLKPRGKALFNGNPCLMAINYLSDLFCDKSISDLNWQLYFQRTPKISVTKCCYDVLISRFFTSRHYVREWLSYVVTATNLSILVKEACEQPRKSSAVPALNDFSTFSWRSVAAAHMRCCCTKHKLNSLGCVLALRLWW